MPLSGGGSGGYAARLSEYKNKGVVGLPERHDSTRVLEKKLLKLAQLVYASPKIAVLTGAGISTSAGIPDFRGPKGIWTLEDKEKKKAGKSRKRKHEETSTEGGGEEVTLEMESPPPPSDDPPPPPDDPFQAVPPTPTHMALAKLVSCNVLQCIITQNVDGVHLRSGVPRDKLCILHGDCFTEKCEKCGEEYFRDFDIGGVSFKYTGRSCEKADCDGLLRDTILDWEDELPEKDWDMAQDVCDEADLVLALGTSLRIVPAGQLPLRAKKFVIVNLQNTPYDSEAELVIHAKVDEVMTGLMKLLRIPFT